MPLHLPQKSHLEKLLDGKLLLSRSVVIVVIRRIYHLHQCLVFWIRGRPFSADGLVSPAQSQAGFKLVSTCCFNQRNKSEIQNNRKAI